MINNPPHIPSPASWPTNVFDECDALRHKADNLGCLATAFARTGNTQVAQDLFEIRTTIEIAEKAIRDHLGQHCSDSLREIQALSGTILKSALAGVKIGRGGAS